MLDQADITMSVSLHSPGKCLAVACDLQNLEGVKTLSDYMVGTGKVILYLICTWQKRTVNRLDILVNNSGKSWGEPMATFPEEGWDL